jgi:hypothetical protein
VRLRREVGFWGTLGRMRFSQLASPEFLGALTLGAGGSLALLWHTDATSRVGIVGDFLILSGALLGIVFAGFSLVVMLLSDSHLRWLNEAPGGVKAFLTPFVFATGLQVGTILGSVIYRAAGSVLPSSAEKAVFVVLSFLFVYALLDVVALARNLVAHGLVRSGSAGLEDLDEARRRREQREGQ